MGASVPCLGFPSRTAAVVALRAEGLRLREIARRAGLTAEEVSMLEGSARQRRRMRDRRSSVGVASDVQPYRRLWARLLAAGDGATAGELAADVGTSFQTVEFRLKLWLAAGLIEAGGSRPRRYRLAPTTERTALPPAIAADGRATPRAPTAYQRLWTAMRVLKTFDIPILIITAQASAQTVRGYIGLLRRAGYLRTVRSRQLGVAGDHDNYALVRNTGRHAPRERVLVPERGQPGRRRELFDPNTGARTDITPQRSAEPAADGGVS